MAEAKLQSSPRMSDEAVAAKTGKAWHEWFEVLDAAGAGDMPHKDIAMYLHEQQGVPAWWAQMVTNEYEKARGRRVLHEKPGGFEISRSKTIAVSIDRLYDAWSDESQREKWLPGHSIEITTARENKSIRARWHDGGTTISVDFYAKGDEKTQVVIQHAKLTDADHAEAMKAFWGDTLDALQSMLKH
jgi:uncharacterized protein YndB with AHSA1/START domain